MTDEPYIEIDLSSQQLTWLGGQDEMRCYPVSTAKNGAGELLDSECTPRGRHRIEEKIGAGEQANTVFVGRRPTGETYDPQFGADNPSRDWILTRILWLGGTEQGVNSGGKCDSKSRYIYIHGTPDETEMRIPGSRGCVRMRNADIIELFDLVEVGTRVEIIE